MIDLYTQIIIIILVILLTLLFTKIIFTHKGMLKSNINEHFVTTTSVADNTNVYDKLIKRDKGDISDLTNTLLKDQEFILFLNRKFREKSNKCVINKDGNCSYDKGTEGDTINDIINNNIKMNKHVVGINTDEIKITEKLDKIKNKYNELNKKYLLKKKHMEKLMLNQLNEDTQTNEEFNKENIKLQKKLKEFTNTILSFKEGGPFSKAKIMSNIATNNEISLNILKDKSLIQKFYSSVDNESYKNEPPDIYLVSFNNVCLMYPGEQNELENRACQTHRVEQFFTIEEIDSNETYNKMIKISGNHLPEHLIKPTTKISYPFKLICPFSKPGYALYIKDDNISVRPIRNDIHQHFKEIYYSSWCIPE